MNKYQKKIQDALEYIDKNGTIKIIELAVANWITPNFDGVVFFDTVEKQIVGDSWTTSTVLNPNSNLIEIFRIDGNWVSNGNWESQDIVTENEQEELEKRYGADWDFLSAAQLESIDIEFSERIIDYLINYKAGAEIVDVLKQKIKDLKNSEY